MKGNRLHVALVLSAFLVGIGFVGNEPKINAVTILDNERVE